MCTRGSVLHERHRSKAIEEAQCRRGREALSRSALEAPPLSAIWLTTGSHCSQACYFTFLDNCTATAGIDLFYQVAWCCGSSKVGADGRTCWIVVTLQQWVQSHHPQGPISRRQMKDWRWLTSTEQNFHVLSASAIESLDHVAWCSLLHAASSSARIRDAASVHLPPTQVSHQIKWSSAQLFPPPTTN